MESSPSTVGLGERKSATKSGEALGNAGGVSWISRPPQMIIGLRVGKTVAQSLWLPVTFGVLLSLDGLEQSVHSQNWLKNQVGMYLEKHLH